MTLTLDDVRNMKFRIARRSGYEVLDVDQFVDRVEEAFAQLTEENQQLKQEVTELRRAAEAAAADRPSAPALAPEPVGEAASLKPAEPWAAQSEPAVSATSTAPGGERVVVTTADDASPAVVRLVQLATEQSERLVDEAREESDQILTKARQEATSITGAARTQAERLESEARLTADRLRNEAQNRATAFEEELRNRRRDTFQAMEAERDQLRDSVGKLRTFEQSFRTNITEHLQAQIKAVADSKFEPGEAPSLLTPADDEDKRGSRRGAAGSTATTANAAPAETQPPTQTPRLDALLGGQN